MKKIIFLSLFVLPLLVAQQRALLHITPDGKQEALPMREGEKISDAISRFAKIVPSEVNSVTGMLDTIRNTIPPINVNFGFAHQDVAFQWFVPAADGNVKELWWYQWNKRGSSGKAHIRGWNADPRLLTLPSTAYDGTGRMGYYVKVDDGDGHVTPFKAEATDSNFYAGNGSDSSKLKFDPLGTESAWKAGGVEVTPDTTTWNKLVLSRVAGSAPFIFAKSQPFGFTIQNASPSYVDDGAGVDIRFEILSALSVGAPYHSIKFYEFPTAAANKPGWQIRSYEWGMFVVVEYTSSPHIYINITQLFSTTDTTARKVCVDYREDFPGGRDTILPAVLYYKISPAIKYDSVSLVRNDSTKQYCGYIPGAPSGSTVAYYAVVTSAEGYEVFSRSIIYHIFKSTSKNLFMYNYRTDIPGFGPVDLASLYFDPIKDYDIWNVKSYGVTDLPALLPNYDVIVEACGDGGNVGKPTIGSPAVEAWLASGTPAKPKLYFFSDQDHGWISNYADTTFADTDVHAKYFGVKTLGPQDYPNGSTKPWNIIVNPFAAKNDSVVSFIDKFQKTYGVSLWYDIKYELSSNFANWMDEIKPTADARVLFRDTTGGENRVIGVRKSSSNGSWATVYLAFDQLALDFRSDTSVAPASDLKYRWIIDAGNMVEKWISQSIFNWGDGVDKIDNNGLPKEFALSNNYPNPFNPSTVINYQLPIRSTVSLKIFDLLGREVATLVNEEQTAGWKEVKWNAKNISSGVYFYRLQAGNYVSVRKMIVLQ